MTDLLVNLAALRAEFDHGEHDLIKQFMPLVGYSLSQIDGEIISETDLQERIYDTMQFRVPFGAIRLFINRSINRRYNYLIKNRDGTYSPNRKELSRIQFSQLRDRAYSHQSELKRSFKAFCENQFSISPASDEIDQHFFEILFDIAPQIMRTLAASDQFDVGDQAPESDNHRTFRYRVYAFVSQVVKEEGIELQYIEEFLQGAIMAESFFYSEPNEALSKMKDVKVFFDTPLLIAALGLSERAETEAVSELIQLLRNLKAKVRCFEDSKGELHGIIYAILKAKESGRQVSLRPGDMGDVFNRNGYKLSDIQILLDSLEDKLAECGIVIEDRPMLAESQNSISEADLVQRLEERFSRDHHAYNNDLSADKRIKHDVDCIQAVFQHRGFVARRSIEHCSSIFITTNTGLTFVTTEFFEEHLESLTGQGTNVPLCMSSNVFTMLMWLKSSGRRNTITKDRLVANSIAAITPSRDLWDTFLENLKKLVEQGDVSEDQFTYISNAIETRTILMSQTEGVTRNLTVGTTHDIKDKVIKNLLGEKEQDVADRDSTINDLKREIDELKSNIAIEQETLEEKINKIFRWVIWNMFRAAIAIIVIFPTIILFFISKEGGFTSLEISLLIATSLASVLTIASLYVIRPWKNWLRTRADRFGSPIVKWLVPPTEK